MNRMKWLVFVSLALLLVTMPLLAACTKEVVKEVPVEKVVEKEVVKEVPVEKVVEKEVIKEVPVEKVVIKDEGSLHHDQPIPPSLTEPFKPRGTVISVSVGDTIAELAADYYGRVDSGILQAIKEENPNLTSIDLIYEGQEIFLPDINPAPQVLYSVSVASYHSVGEAKAVFLAAATSACSTTKPRCWFNSSINLSRRRRSANATQTI